MLRSSSRRLLAGLPLLALALGPLPLTAQTVFPVATQSTATLAPGTAFRNAIAEAAADDVAIAGFFRDRGFAPYWTEAAAEERRAALMRALAGAGGHGLPVGRYDPEALIAAFRAARTDGDRGRLEVLMSRALLDYARDVQTGALVPGKIDAGIKREVPVRDRRANLDAFAAAANPGAFLRGLPPTSQEYAQLMKAKLSLEEAVSRGGWGIAVPNGAALEPGASGAPVMALRDRLVAMGYLDRSAVATYDATIVRAVRQFQADHGLEPDGAADRTTLAEINIGPEARLRSVVVAMERERWLNIDRGRRHIWVNLTDYTAKIIDNGKVTFETRAVVGDLEAAKHTPEFSHVMTYMEVNPDWTVPPGILRRDYLPRLQANPNALGHLQLVDRRARAVARGAVNFAAYTAGNFPFSLRQPPGDSNALGKVKFMFPNPHAIYLHDTPHKELFVREARAFSNGCIRLADPFEFAYELLSRQEADPKSVFDAVLNRGRQERISLAEPVQVHLEYRTAFANPKGHMQYRRDMYGRDALIWQALVKAGVVPGATAG